MKQNSPEQPAKRSLAIGDAAPVVSLKDHQGDVVSLDSLWPSRPRVLLFVRHFGWPMCREHVVDVRDDYPRFQAAGGDIAVITMGSVEQTAAFRDRNRLPFVCLADPERIAYQAYGVPRASVLQVAGPAVWAGGLRATLRAGFAAPVGDVLQLHGSFIVDTQGVIRYIYSPKHSADQPSNDDLVGQLNNVAGANVGGGDEHR